MVLRYDEREERLKNLHSELTESSDPDKQENNSITITALLL